MPPPPGLKLPRYDRIEELRETGSPRTVFYANEEQTVAWLLFEKDANVPFPILGELKDGKWYYKYVDYIGSLD